MLKNLTRALFACLLVSGCFCHKGGGGGDGGFGDGGGPDGGPDSGPTWTGNYRFVWPVSDTSALAAVAAASDMTGTLGSLHFLSSGGTVDTVIKDNVIMGSVKVNLKGGQPSAIFIAEGNAAAAQGKVFFVDLRATTPSAAVIPVTGPFGGANIYYGATGQEILTLKPVSPGDPPRSPLYWANGKDMPKRITDLATTVVFSPDRSTVIVADNLTTNGICDLLKIDMSSGASSKVVSGAKGLDSRNQPLFAVAGNTLAYLSGTGDLQTVQLDNNTSTKTIDSSSATSKVAGLSADGTKIAYLTGPISIGAMNSDVMFASTDGTDTPVKIGTVQQSGVAPVRPIVSPDGKAVLYFSGVANKEGLIGSAWLASTAGGTALKLGDAAAVAQYVFGDCGFNVAVVTGLQDATGTPYAKGIGTVTRTTPGSECKLTGTTLTNLLPGPVASGANGLHSADFEPFRSHDYLSFVGGYKLVGEMRLGKAYIAPMGAGMASEIPGAALANSLESSTSTEKVLFVGNATVDNTGLGIGELFIGYPDGSSSPILSDVVDAHFTPDGHAFVITQTAAKTAVRLVAVP